MAVQSSLSNPPSLASITAGILFNPLLTGPLLLYVLRHPSVLEKLPWPPTKYYKLPFELPFPFPNRIRVGATAPLKTLKFLFTWGLILSVNRFLNRLALNYGHLKKQGEPWEFQTEGKETVLITGGCSGFGKEMAKMLADQTKAKIIVLDVQALPDDLKDVPRLSYYKVDLTSPPSIHETIKQVLETSSVPTVLINNAGIAQAHTILSTSDEFVEKIFRVNVLSHFTLLRLLLPRMMAQRKGHVVTIASMASYTGCPSLADYCATKHAVLGMHESLVAELATRYKDQGGHCIQASTVHPLWARTPLVGSWERQLVASRAPVLEAKDVAGPVVRHVLTGRSGSVFVPERFRYATIVKGLPDWVGIKMRLDLAVNTDVGREAEAETETQTGEVKERKGVEESWVET
ncbi:17-beta-hydroxysteroid dehydrogenase 13 [Cladophialophora carrionii]|uniref:17-beta-hydroxysteroid dehydrogenase 13 n=1 Tax=Cladophialophora carrionii TaxID=86049 RepID=A0A1C1CGW0_9EURO|nr:17-beta-hydroxysteroid dehydrogenase 13 [Cladophialophora carrionii]